MNLKNRLQHGWNAFLGRDPTPTYVSSYSSTTRPDYIHLTRGSERSMVNAVLNRIAVDVASISVDHARTDENGRYKEPMKSQLNECLNLAANNDQTGRAFIQDIAMSLLDEGVVAIVPTTATENPMTTGSYDIGSMRVGRVVEWHPTMVKVNLYNEMTGQREDHMFPKAMVALPENPFYETMNEPNSIYQRLCTKLRQLAAYAAGVPKKALCWYLQRGKVVWLNNHAEADAKEYFDIIKVGNKTLNQCIKDGTVVPGDILGYMTLSHTNAYPMPGFTFDSGHLWCEDKGEGAKYTRWVGPLAYGNYKISYIFRIKK